ncbi:hypothetical protein RB195_020920 [Necator americanus]|uniref:VWFA domain-containing protein n=1 Tax=Necator americanus TaxID=51031 RepID=A0ABR1CL75_NECAM
MFTTRMDQLSTAGYGSRTSSTSLTKLENILDDNGEGTKRVEEMLGPTRPEGDLIHKVGHDLFDRSPHSSIGLWAYGYTNFSKSVETSLEKMRGKLDDFVNDLRLMEYFKIQDPVTTVNAIEKLNEVQDPKGRANCLVFFSAKQNTKFLPLLYPNHMNLDRIIAVGLNNTNLDRVVTKQQVALSIPLNHLDEDVQIIVDAIMGTYKPTSTLKPTTAPPKPTTTLKPTTAPPKPSTTSAKPTPPPNALECLFVGDLYNYGENVDEYEREARFISTVVHDFFEEPLGYSAGLWAYGFSKFPKSPDLNRMSFNYDEIKTYLDDIKYTAIVDPLKTSSAVDAINKLKDNGSRANCLVFFSAEMNSTALPKLNPQNKKFKRIVAVGLNDTDLSSVITSDGISVSVPLHPRSEDVKSVIDAIMGRYKPTSKPTTTVLPTTTVIPTTKTVAPSRSPDCLFVGDLYNFEDDENAYEHEAEFIAEVTEKFFDESGSSSAGIWAYGHTDFLKTVNSSLENMSRHHHEFLLQLEKMSYAKTDDPLTTSQAIGAINEMYDTENRINCLVFFSAQEDTRGLPRIEPQHMRLDKVVAVGYNDRNLNDIIPNYGVAISVSKEYEEKDVEHVVRAILRR